MFGCLRRLGCLAVLLLAAGLYLTRDTWWSRVAPVIGRPAPAVAPADSSARLWEPLDPGRAAAGERAVRALAARRGPVYVNLRAGELASYVFLSLVDTPPLVARDAEAAVIGNRIYLRSVVSVGDLGGAVGGAVGRLLPQRDTLRLGGTFESVRPGLVQFRVEDVRLGDFPIPAAVLPRVVQRVAGAGAGGGASDTTVARDAIPIAVPPYIGDVRVARGRITLYRTTP